jgi:hypothetical protein
MTVSYLALASGVYLCGFAFLINTPDFKSSLFFKLAPGLIGVGLLIHASKGIGLI